MMDLNFKNNLLRVWGYDEERQGFNFDEEKFWRENHREIFFMSIFSQRIPNPNDKLLDFLLENQAIKKKISKLFATFFRELFSKFSLQHVVVSNRRISLSVLSQEWALKRLERLVLESGHENIEEVNVVFYVEELDLLVHFPQDFTFYCIAPCGFKDQTFEEMIFQNGMYLWK